jgi:hypothetical protein
MTDSREKAKAAGWKPVNQVDPFPDHIKDWAYQLWAYKCARDSKRVVAYMKVGEHDGTEEMFPPTKISDRTIREWAKRYNWAERQLKENKALHADQFNMVSAQNIHNSVDAVRVQAETLHMVKADLEAKADYVPEYDEKGKLINPLPAMRLDPREIKAIADLTNGILDRAGHTAWTRKDISDQPVGPTASHRDAIGGKTMDELLELSRMKIFEITASTPVARDSGATLDRETSSVIEGSLHAPDQRPDRGAS